MRKIRLAMLLLLAIPLGAPGALAAEACLDVDASWWIEDPSRPGRARVASCPDDLHEGSGLLYSSGSCEPSSEAAIVVCGKNDATPPDGPGGVVMVTGCGRANGSVVSVEGGEPGCLLFP